QITLIVEELSIAQWAQDNGKPGVDVDGRPIILVPRYASRGEVGTTFVPGETYLMNGVAAANVKVVQSSLLFQGGNLLAVRDPGTNQRILLIGEAEIQRNKVLGLTDNQIL